MGFYGFEGLKPLCSLKQRGFFWFVERCDRGDGIYLWWLGAIAATGFIYGGWVRSQ
ncbi:MAG: hypothetical protein V7K48_12950 [Nostoc sp.]|uniref:hypothetical protein n=1 Tax=Nostoc sp. TaxID=1180 RepID=UPI002FF5E596